jgi:hypothetical protein
MKALVIGVDGGDLDVINKMDMPVFKRIIASYHNYDPTEDLFQRGWAKVYSGQGADVTGGAYIRASKPGSADFSQNYSMASSGNEGFVTIWELLQSKGYSVGVVNPPTAKLNGEVNGFFVSGGGGGVVASGEPDPGMYYPPTLKKLLIETNYTFDIRSYATKYSSVVELLDEMDASIEAAAKFFIAANKIHNVDYGFVCFRVTTEIQYLCKFYLDMLKNDGSYDDSATEEDIAIINRIKIHYKVLDESIALIMSATSPEWTGFVADHGVASYEYNVNLNELLRDLGYQPSLSFASKLLHTVKTRLRGMLPLAMKSKIKSSVSIGLVEKTLPFNSSSSAIAPERFGGIFLNDDRFFGIIKSDRKKFITGLCNKLNDHWLSLDLDLRFDIADDFSGQFSTLMPDIVVSGNDRVWFRNTGLLSEKNKNYGGLPTEFHKARNPFSGIRGCKPMMLSSKEIKLPYAIGDLRDFFNITLYAMEEDV